MKKIRFSTRDFSGFSYLDFRFPGFLDFALGIFLACSRFHGFWRFSTLDFFKIFNLDPYTRDFGISGIFRLCPKLKNWKKIWDPEKSLSEANSVLRCYLDSEAGRCVSRWDAYLAKVFNYYCITLLFFIENFKCNCDTFPGQRLDEGILSNIEHLPVREVAFGGSSSQFRHGFFAELFTISNFSIFHLNDPKKFHKFQDWTFEMRRKIAFCAFSGWIGGNRLFFQFWAGITRRVGHPKFKIPKIWKPHNALKNLVANQKSHFY